MRIDSLKNSPDRAGRYWLTFDDGTKIGLYRQTVEDFGLYIGKELTGEEKEQLLTAAGKMSAKMRAVRIVSAASVSRKDLEERLVRKGEDPDQAREAVQWMEDLHLVDDRNTAEQVVHSCISKGYGLQRAKQALYEKRIPKQYWEEALADYPVNNALMIQLLSGDTVVYGDEQREKQEHIMTHQVFKRTLAAQPSPREGFYCLDLMPLLALYGDALSRSKPNNFFFTTTDLRDYHYTKQKNNGYYHHEAMNLPFPNVELFYLNPTELEAIIHEQQDRD